MSVTLRTARAEEVALMLDWAAVEGWNPGRADASAFHAADGDGFFLAEAPGAGPVAAISVVNHSADLAFLGLYLCRPEYRGRGIGSALWRHGLAHAGVRTVGLDGVAAQEANYARAGFVRAGATRRFEGGLAGASGGGLRAVAPSDLPALIALDVAANGFARPAFLRAWLAPAPGRVSLLAEGAAGPEGLVTIRTCARGAKIGPLLAPDAGRALTLAQGAVAALGGAGPVALDLPEANRALAARLLALGFVETFATARMYRGPAPTPGPMLQAIATMELG
ncbi:GNAT family N-acetyltransferase [Rhodobacter xanthinilyticus]|uniref:GNAT family N-acetyltransferase n=1 Tax=Rhodobacter xanthinilyticus TaxID=1850250 RepID=A0A1D9MBE3_9RHOB|nr:GNAT family N-acetyltransferase [Rhodobacter xanthinilyticus]AOZ69182.1 GNAT family N-acetyltransferase [Rhodobacter xanthinilyticus]